MIDILANVFLSYSHQDKAFVRELFRRLTRDGVRCFFDEESIEWGDDFVLTVEHALGKCKFFVSVLSPDFVSSTWATLERTAALAGKSKMRPLLLRECNIPPFLLAIQRFDVSTTAEFEANYPKICSRLGGRVRPDLEELKDRNALPPVTPLRPRSFMPHGSMGMQFVGRIDALWTVYDQLRQGQTSIVQGVGVVYGTGGLGKTQLAVEYVHRFNRYYPGGVFWVDCEQGIQRLIDLLGRSLDLSVDGRLPQGEQLAAIWMDLADRQAMLVVLDNFPEIAKLGEWLPPVGDIHVLVTTRRRDLARYPRLTLPFLTTEEGQRILGHSDDESRALVEDVGGLPLAVEILRAYLAQRTDISVRQLRDAMKETDQMELLEQFAREYRDHLPSGHGPSVAATFRLSWNLATVDGQDLLRVMCHLAPVPVPHRLLRCCLGWDESDPINDRLFTAIADLSRLSLVESSANNQPSAHRLILGFVRRFGEGYLRWPPTVAAVEREMDRAFDDSDAASVTEVESVAPHAEVMLAWPDLDAENGAEIAADLWRHNTTVGRYQAAVINANAAATYFARCDPSIRDRKPNLATALDGLAELNEAIAILTSVLNSKNLVVLAAKFLQRPTTIGLRELAEARDLVRKVLVSADLRYPRGHPFKKLVSSRLMKVVNGLEEFSQFLDLLQRALETSKRRYAPGHPYIATSQYNLGVALGVRGDLVLARDLIRDALESAERRNPPEEPRFIAIQQGVMSTLLKRLGEYSEAKAFAQKALDSSRVAFGSDHPETQHCKCLLDSLKSTS